MKRFSRSFGLPVSAVPFRIGLCSLALAAGGCSADVARFDSPGFNLNGSTAAIPTPPGRVRPAGGTAYLGGEKPGDQGPGTTQGGAYIPPPRAVKESGVQVAALPEPAKPSSLPPAQVSEPRRTAPVAAASPIAPSGAKGEQIEVQQGDTLYGISKRYKVSLNELLQVNGLTNPNLKPGQKLYLPAGKGARKPLTKPAAIVEATPVGAAPAAPVATQPAAVPVASVDTSGWNGTYTVKAGDSLYALSRQLKVKMTDLQAANNIADVRKVRPGAVLKVPGDAPAPQAAAAAAQASEPAVASAPRVVQSTTRPTIINGGEQKVASLGNEAKATDATSASVSNPAPAPAVEAAPAKPAEKTAAAAAGSGKLRWPVKGKIITAFGQRPDGTHNDGVNLSVPLGTEVHAADGGVVAYAGSELKGYGNLVLVRHDNGWVTAYAHNEEILVKRGDKVKRGQLIGKAGKSGQVDQPQVHFELRQGSKPVDPTPYMEKL